MCAAIEKQTHIYIDVRFACVQMRYVTEFKLSVLYRYRIKNTPKPQTRNRENNKMN